MQQLEQLARRLPAPVADAICRLCAAPNVHARRDGVVEVFRAGQRYLVALALAPYALGKHPPAGRPVAPKLDELLRKLHRKSLTDGQWFDLWHQLVGPWLEAAEVHPLPSMVRMKISKKIVRATDQLLQMRTKHTISHSATGDARSLPAVLDQRMPQLVTYLERLEMALGDTELVVPARLHGQRSGRQLAHRLMGFTPLGGRWPLVELLADDPLPVGRPLLVDARRSPVLDLYPVALFRVPDVQAVAELFVLDGFSGSRARFLALPSMNEVFDEDAGVALEARLFLTTSAEPDADARPEQPYVGLRSFETSEASLFFGRERLAERLANRIRTHPFVTITGPSGCGKSSLVHAGIVPRLGGLGCIVLRPGPKPAELLDRAVQRFLQLGPRRLSKAPSGVLIDDLAAWVEEHGEHILLVVDQAEELFTLCSDPQERQAFAEQVRVLGAESGDAVRVLISIREDFFGCMATLPPLEGVCHRQVEVLAVPDRHALGRILTGPLRFFGAEFEDQRLVETMLDRVEGQAASLALLQFCAARLWSCRDPRTNRLTRSEYERIGGIEGALARHASSVLARLSSAQRQLVRGLLLPLVTAQGTRAVLPRVELEASTDDPTAAATVLDGLIAERLIVSREGEDGVGAEGATVELAHEALIEHWEELRGWLEEDREGQRLRDSVRRAAGQWERQGRSPDLLWRGDMLASLLHWRGRVGASLLPREQAFVRASLASRRRRRQRLGSVVAGAALVALGVGLVILDQRQEAGRARFEQQQLEQENVREQQLLARIALEGDRPIEAYARLRNALESRDSLMARALWHRIQHNPLVWREELDAEVSGMAFHPQGTMLAVARASPDVLLLDPWTLEDEVLDGGQDNLYTVAFSLDGRYLAAGEGEGKVVVWDLESRGKPVVLEGHAHIVSSLAFDRVGGRLLTGSFDGSVKIWDLASKEVIRDMVGHESYVTTVAWGAGERTVVSTGEDGSIFVWDALTGERHAELPGHDDTVSGSATLDGGRSLLSASWDGSLRVWDLVATTQSRAFQQHGSVFESLAVDPWAERWAVGDTLGRVLVGGLDLEETPLSWSADDAGLSALAWDPRTGRLATGSVTRAIALWNVTPSGHGGEDRGHTGAVAAVAYAPDGGSLASGGWDGTVRLWDARTGHQLQVLEGHKGPVHDVTFSPTHGVLASAGADRAVRLWDLQSGQTTDVLHGHGDAVKSVSFAADGATLASSGWDGTVRLWSVEDGRANEGLVIEHEGVGVTVISPGGRDFAVAWSSGTVELRSLPTGELRWRHELDGRLSGRVQSLVFDATGRSLWASTNKGRVLRWSLARAEPSVVLETDGAARCLALDPRGAGIAVSTTEPSLALHWPDQAHSVALRGHSAVVSDCVFDPQGATLATAGFDGTVRTWDVEEGVPAWRGEVIAPGYHALLNHDGWQRWGAGEDVRPPAKVIEALSADVTAASHAPTKNTLCVLSSDGNLEQWDSQTDTLLFRVDDPGISRIVAHDAGCAASLGDGRAVRWSGDGVMHVMQHDVSALGLTSDGLLTAGAGAIRAHSPEGEVLWSFPPPVDRPVAVMGAPEGVVVGSEQGDMFVVFRGADGAWVETPCLETPAFAVSALGVGLEGTVVAGFADGTVGLWSAATGERLLGWKLHGPVRDLHVDEATLVAMTELGDHLAVDLSDLRMDYCQLMEQVWELVPVGWDVSRPVMQPRPEGHGCVEGDGTDRE